jgi:hypothetical protein
MNCEVSPSAFSTCVPVPGIIVSEVKVAGPVTLRLAVPVTGPKEEDMVAVMEVVPAPIPEANPSELTVATAGLLDAHVTELVRSSVVWGWPGREKVPVAVNCTVTAPAAIVALFGVTEIEDRFGDDAQLERTTASAIVSAQVKAL